MLTVNRQFINSYQSRIASLLNGTTDAQMPSNVASMFPNVESGSTYVEYFAKLVKTALANVAASLNKLKEGDTQYALMIHGGASDSTIGSVNGDIWFYDLLTGLWQVPVRGLSIISS
jgi:hypothetical protein